MHVFNMCPQEVESELRIKDIQLVSDSAQYVYMKFKKTSHKSYCQNYQKTKNAITCVRTSLAILYYSKTY